MIFVSYSISAESAGPDETGEGFLHFGKRGIFKRRPWYKRVGLTYIRVETDNYIHKYLFLSVRIGRDLNISDRIGIQVDAGAGVQLFYKQTRKDPRLWV